MASHAEWQGEGPAHSAGGIHPGVMRDDDMSAKYCPELVIVRPSQKYSESTLIQQTFEQLFDSVSRVHACKQTSLRHLLAFFQKKEKPAPALPKVFFLLVQIVITQPPTQLIILQSRAT